MTGHHVVLPTWVPLAVALTSAACGGGSHSLPTTQRPAARVIADSPAPKAPGLPVAAVHEVVDRYFGVDVTDPYRWMETPGSAELDGWLRGQDAFTRSALARLPGRAQLTARTIELAKSGARVEGVRKAGDKYFYLTRPAGAELWKLCVRDQRSATARVLVDAERLSSADAHASVDYFVPSPDGKLVAFGISTNGSEETSLQVIETATGRALSEHIDRTGFANLSWLPDGRSFFYMRYPKLAPGTPSSERSRRMRAYVHALDGRRDGSRCLRLRRHLVRTGGRRRFPVRHGERREHARRRLDSARHAPRMVTVFCTRSRYRARGSVVAEDRRRGGRHLDVCRAQ